MTPDHDRRGRLTRQQMKDVQAYVYRDWLTEHAYSDMLEHHWALAYALTEATLPAGSDVTAEQAAGFLFTAADTDQGGQWPAWPWRITAVAATGSYVEAFVIDGNLWATRDGGRLEPVADLRLIRQRWELEHRREWADHIRTWLSARGPQPPTVTGIVAKLDADQPPFGRAQGTAA